MMFSLSRPRMLPGSPPVLCQIGDLPLEAAHHMHSPQGTCQTLNLHPGKEDGQKYVCENRKLERKLLIA